MNERRKYRVLFTLISIVLLASMIAPGQVVRSVSGHVTDVYDGNTITVTDVSGSVWKVRLAAVDAPELSQSFGKKVRKELLELLLDHPVTVKFDRTEAGDKIIGIVELESQREALVAIFPININQYMVGEGLAWYDRSFKSSQSKETQDVYSKLEADARERKKGLWAEKNPIPPWEFRGRSNNADVPPLSSAEANENQRIIANKTSGLYYFSYCPDYDKVPTLEQVSFKRASDAQAAGFKLAKNCQLK